MSTKKSTKKAHTYKILAATTSQNYPIVAGSKRTGSAEMSAQKAAALLNPLVSAGTPVDIAASTVTLEEEGTTKYAEWNVYVLVES